MEGRQGDLMVCALDSGASGPGLRPGRGHCVVFLGKTLTTIFVDSWLRITKHPGKHFQNFRQSCVLSTDWIEIHQSQPLVWPSHLLYVMLAGCDWWISIRSVDNMYDWRKFWKRFRECFVFEIRVSTKTVVNLGKVHVSQCISKISNKSKKNICGNKSAIWEKKYPFIPGKIITECLNLMSFLYISHVMRDLLYRVFFCAQRLFAYTNRQPAFG